VWGLPRGVLILLGLATATVTIAGLRSIAGIAGPVFLALVLTIAASPVRDQLTRRGLPRWFGTLATIVVVYAVLFLLTASLVVAAARFATLIPSYKDELADVLDGVQGLLANLGVDTEQSQHLLSSFDLARLADLVTTLLSGTLSLLTNLGFVVTLVLFICVDASWFGAQLEIARRQRPGFVEALESFAHGTRTYLVVSTIFGLVVAAIDTVLVWALGIPGALLWGLLAFITNYIPNIGFVLGLIPPAVLALLEGGPGLMITVIVAYSVINVIIQSVIQPKLVGDAVGLSASVTFISLVVWAWVLGPLGAVLAIPLTLLAKALLVDVDPHTRWIDGLIGDRGPASSP
jgi:predicted PurR-regulated permease PerM